MNDWATTSSFPWPNPNQGLSDHDLWGYGKYFTTTDNTRELQRNYEQQQQQGYRWQQMQQIMALKDPKEEELSLLKEIRSRAQYYAMVILCEQGVAA
jgi:hypothetical protein